MGVGLDQNIGLIKKGSKRYRGRRWAKVNGVHGVILSFSGDDSVQVQSLRIGIALF